MKKNNRNLLILTLIAVAVTLLFNSLIAVYKIKGNSMLDYFTEGQYVFCLKKNFLYWDRTTKNLSTPGALVQ